MALTIETVAVSDDLEEYSDTIQSLMEDETLAHAYLAAGCVAQNVDETWYAGGGFYGVR